MAKFTKDSKKHYLEKKRQDPNLSSTLYQTKELLADDPETTNRKLQESVSLVVAKVRRAIRKDRSTLEKELKLLKDAVNIYKSVRELDLKVLEIQLKSKQSQELALQIVNLNNLPDEQLKKLAMEVLQNGAEQYNIKGREERGHSIPLQQPLEELQGEPLGETAEQHNLLQETSQDTDQSV